MLAASHDLGRVQASSEVVAVVDSGKACMFAAVAKKKLAGGRLPTGTRGKIQSRQALLTLQHQHPVVTRCSHGVVAEEYGAQRWM